jgi:hypothetical protein
MEITIHTSRNYGKKKEHQNKVPILKHHLRRTYEEEKVNSIHAQCWQWMI